MLASLDDVFRFVQLRPPRPHEDVEAIALLPTRFAQSLVDLDRSERAPAADRFLADTGRSIRGPGDLHYGRDVADAIASTTAIAEATTGDLIDAVGDLGDDRVDDQFVDDEVRLSDTLVARMFSQATPVLDVRQLEQLFRGYALVADSSDERSSRPLSAYFGLPLLLPMDPVSAPGTQNDQSPHDDGSTNAPQRPMDVSTEGEHPEPVTDADVQTAIRELATLDNGAHLVQPSQDGGQPFTLTAQARTRLSSRTRRVLERVGIDLDITPVHAAVGLLDDAGSDAVTVGPRPPFALSDSSTDPAPQGPTLRPAGVAHLLVVKQQIKKYEAAEIAHVENILAGEKRSRTHRDYERTEETITTQVETTREEQNELQTTDRFELNRETSRTIQQDRSIGFELSLSGKYGPTVEFSSNATLNASQQTQESARNASTYSKDIMQRSLQRVSERVLEERIQRIIRESEETNLHELQNQTAEHRNGVYQFLDKVYEAQVFDYGVREMFDFMIPEPASFLWYVDKIPETAPVLPDPPRPLDSVVKSAAEIDEKGDRGYEGIAALYGATDVEAPPQVYQTVIGTFEHGEDNASEEGKPRSKGKIELAVPDGYQPWQGYVNLLALSDEDPVIAVSAGGYAPMAWEPGANDRYDDPSSNYSLAYQPSLYFDFTNANIDPTAESKFVFDIVAFETSNYNLNVMLVVKRLDKKLRDWRLSTYAKIRNAYEDRLQEYTQKVADLKAQAEAEARARETANRYGAPPTQNKQTIKDELKKQCIAVITQQWFGGFNAFPQSTDPPIFDFAAAATQGSFTRFFEQAFEWDQIQYVCYPYFWSRQSTWLDRFRREDTDPEFRDFWRAGAARVVVPVRPGFEVAVTHYMETGVIWNGEGDPPDITSPLYVSIVDEIKQRTGAPAGEIPVGDPWNVRVPTSLLLVRRSPDLPEWERVDPDGWEWQPVAADGDG